VKARDVGIEVVYEGIRLTPEEIASSARDEGVHVIGLLDPLGSHGVLVIDVLERLRAGGCARAGRGRLESSPRRTRARCAAAGVARVYTPKDFDLTRDHGRDRRRRSESRAAA
jgi:(2R)-ethylmalonyl-CoA mutase